MGASCGCVLLDGMRLFCIAADVSAFAKGHATADVSAFAKGHWRAPSAVRDLKVLAAWSRHPRTNFCDGTAVHQDALKNGLLRVAGLALEHAQLTIWYQCNIATIHSENAHQPLTGACAPPWFILNLQ